MRNSSQCAMPGVVLGLVNVRLYLTILDATYHNNDSFNPMSKGILATLSPVSTCIRLFLKHAS